MTALAGATSSDVLRRADGVQLIGEMPGSGYREPPALVRRGDGQTFQLTPLLYQLLQLVDGGQSVDTVAGELSRRSGKTVTADNVRTLVDDRLRPLGLLTRPDGSQPEVKRSNPLLGLRFRYAVTDAERTRRLTTPFRVLFRPVFAVPLLAAFALVCWWVFFSKGLASATYQAFQHPGLLLLVIAVTVLSAGFHEFGHAAAARYGGATPGVMGAGLYVIWPAFYTDVTDSYRLGRGGRLRTDLGGLYFNAIVAVAVAGAWLMTGYDALLLVVATQILQMLRQLTPLVRFDGYHVLADLTGVPDLFHRIKPTLLSLLPWRWGHPDATVLKAWARAVVTIWVVVVVPALLAALALMVLALPHVLATAWAKLQAEQGQLATTWGDGDVVASVARVIAMAAVALPILGSFVILTRTLRRASTSVWRGTRGRPGRRALAVLAAVSVLAGLVWAWWPDEKTWEPIQPGMRGRVTDVFGGYSPRSGALTSTSATAPQADAHSATAVWDTSQPLPDRQSAQLALVLTPHDGDTDQAWVFPFNKPLAPEPGDNQALAVNTTDGTTTYDAAFALVWADGDHPVTNTNEAYAFASCKSCAAVAIAFQVVLVVGDAPVVAPENLAGALTYHCANCLTYALAQQLFLTLDGPLSDEAMKQLDELWAQIADYADHIEDVPLDQIDDQLDTFEQQILDIIEADQPGTVPSPAASANGPSPSAGSSPSSDASVSMTPGSSSPPSDSSESPTDTPTDSPSSASASSSPSASPSG